MKNYNQIFTLEGKESSEQEFSEEFSVPLSCKDNNLRIKPFQNMDAAKKVVTRSHLLNRQSGNNYASSSYCNAVSKPDTGSNRNVFVSARYSRWDDSRRLRSNENTITDTPTVYSDDNNHKERMQDHNNTDITGGSQTSKVDLKTLLMMFLKRSSIYALNQVGNSSTTRRKVFWAFIMIVGILGSAIQISQYLQAYFSYPVVVNMNAVYRLDQEFPAVTICNLNRIQNKFLPCLKQALNHNECNLSAVDDQTMSIKVVNDMDNSNCSGLTNDSVSQVALMRYMWQNLFISLTEESQIIYGHQKENFIQTCSFNGEICTRDNFTEFVNIDYGNCFTFNAANDTKSPLKTPFVGPNSGLELELDLEVEQYAPFTRAVGARVQVHDPYHDENIRLHGINVSPGFETSITLSKFQMLRLPKPYKDECMLYPTGESMESCNEKCANDLILQRCTCSIFGKGTNHCDLTKMSVICCVYSSPGDEECKCPVSCDDTYYQISIFGALWPSRAYHDANPINNSEGAGELSYEDVRENRLKLKVYYDTLETIIYEQNPMYQNSEVFSQIGGQMGLWLGLSLVAIFECVENFVLLWKFRTKKLLQIQSGQ